MKKNNSQFLTARNLARFFATIAMCTRILHFAALAGLLPLWLCTTAFAVDFPGSLKRITIGDAAGTNKPPTAIFSYTQDGEALTFDASGSTDTDGSITKYKWDFGGATTSEGVTATYVLAGITQLQVTLTVVDNNNGIALSQQTIALTVKGIADDFTTDTSGNYTLLSGSGLNVYDGALHTSKWQATVAYHNINLGSNDHSIEADVKYAPENGGGLLVRCNPVLKTGYLVYFESGRLMLKTFSNGSTAYLAQQDGNYTAGIYRLKVSALGSALSISVNGNVIFTKTDNTYTNGTYAGIRLRTGADPAAITLDNLVGE